MPNKRDLIYVRIAENARLRPGALLCNVSVEVSPGQLVTLPSNQIYSFGKSRAVRRDTREQSAAEPMEVEWPPDKQPEQQEAGPSRNEVGKGCFFPSGLPLSTTSFPLLGALHHELHLILHIISRGPAVAEHSGKLPLVLQMNVRIDHPDGKGLESLELSSKLNSEDFQTSGCVHHLKCKVV